MDKQKIKQYLKYIVINVTLAALLSVVLINYVASAYRINGHSMYSVLEHRDRIIIYKLGLRSGNIHRFDIVVLDKPNEPSKSIIKRVIGLPGEEVEIKEGEVYINGRKLGQPFLKPHKGFIARGDNMRPRKVPRDHYFVMGDNRPVSRDSRNFGMVPLHCVTGKTVFRYWPPSRIGKVK